MAADGGKHKRRVLPWPPCFSRPYIGSRSRSVSRRSHSRHPCLVASSRPFAVSSAEGRGGGAGAAQLLGRRVGSVGDTGEEERAVGEGGDSSLEMQQALDPHARHLARAR